MQIYLLKIIYQLLFSHRTFAFFARSWKSPTVTFVSVQPGYLKHWIKRGFKAGKKKKTHTNPNWKEHEDATKYFLIIFLYEVSWSKEKLDEQMHLNLTVQLVVETSKFV